MSEHECERTPTNDGFLQIERQAMVLFAQERTRENVSELLSLLHSLLDYYIRFYLYRFHVYDDNPELGDIYGETYIRCIDLIGTIDLSTVIVPRGDHEGQVGGNGKKRKLLEEMGTIDFNRIKRYLNKSIAGWIYNRVFKKKKRIVELSRDEISVLLHPDPSDQFSEVETAADIELMEAHVRRETPMYVELCAALAGHTGRRELAEKQYRNLAYAHYTTNGCMLSAEDLFGMKYGRAFGEE